MEQKNQENKEDKIEKLLKENLELNKEMKEMIIKINRYVFVRRIFGLVKIIIIILIVFAAFIWLPPFLQDFVNKINEMYSNIVNIGN